MSNAFNYYSYPSNGLYLLQTKKDIAKQVNVVASYERTVEEDKHFSDISKLKVTRGHKE